MLLSMTGHGEGRAEVAGTLAAVEIRTINNRYFKLSLRSTHPSGALEAAVEQLVRQFVRRGTVQVDLQVVRQDAVDDYRLNEAALERYVRQLDRFRKRLGLADPPALEALLALPGVVSEELAGGREMEHDWPAIERALREALERLTAMRAEEGAAMARDLAGNCRLIAQRLEVVERQAPLVVEAYRTRILERLNQLLAGVDAGVEPADVVREIGLFAERSDVSEETVRLRSHLEQFQAYLDAADSNGRKLDFLTQEMFRETNTIGAKANDAEIARQVVEIKSIIERIREMAQNVE